MHDLENDGPNFGAVKCKNWFSILCSVIFWCCLPPPPKKTSGDTGTPAGLVALNGCLHWVTDRNSFDSVQRRAIAFCIGYNERPASDTRADDCPHQINDFPASSAICNSCTPGYLAAVPVVATAAGGDEWTALAGQQGTLHKIAEPDITPSAG